MNLLPFNLEEAKANPERVRHQDGSVPVEVRFASGWVISQWNEETDPSIYKEKRHHCLRLTPKTGQRVVKEGLDAAIKHINNEDWIGTCGCHAMTNRKIVYSEEMRRQWCSCWNEHCEVLDKLNAACAAHAKSKGE